jgi:hypothetical protein
VVGNPHEVDSCHAIPCHALVGAMLCEVTTTEIRYNMPPSQSRQKEWEETDIPWKAGISWAIASDILHHRIHTARFFTMVGIPAGAQLEEEHATWVIRT